RLQGDWSSDVCSSDLGKIAPWAVLGFAALVLVAFVMPTYRQGEPSIARKSAENFDITLGGKSAHLSDLKGKVVVLNFWASYCGRSEERRVGKECGWLR